MMVVSLYAVPLYLDLTLVSTANGEWGIYLHHRQFCHVVPFFSLLRAPYAEFLKFR
jgi:hypothetical protein